MIPRRRTWARMAAALAVSIGATAAMVMGAGTPAFAFESTPATVDFGAVQVGTTEDVSVAITPSEGTEFFIEALPPDRPTSFLIAGVSPGCQTRPIGDCVYTFRFAPTEVGPISTNFIISECTTLPNGQFNCVDHLVPIIGSGVAAVAPGVPQITSLSGGDSQVVVGFTPGDPGFPTDVSYTVTATPTTPGQAPTVTTGPASGSPITVSGLVNGVSYQFVVTATNPTGSTASAGQALTVGTPATITGSAPAGITGTGYTPYTYQVGGIPTPSVAVTAGQLPPGLVLSSVGVLSGTPTTAGSFTYTLTASNGVGSAQLVNTVLISLANTPNKANLVLHVAAPSAGKVGQNFTYTVTVSNQGPAAAKTVVTSLGLPQGTQFVSATGAPTRIGQAIIWATPTISNGSTLTYTVTVKPVSTGIKTCTGITGSLQTPDPTPGNNITTTKTTIT